MIGLWTIGEPHVATAFGSCMYYEEVSTPDPPPEVAFMPGCPTSDVKNPHVSEGDGGRGGIVFSSAAWGSARSFGGWYATAAAVERYGAVGFWIDF